MGSEEVTVFAPELNEMGTFQVPVDAIPVGIALGKAAGDVAEAAIEALAASTVGHRGQDCFDRITGELYRWLGADCVVLGEVVAGTDIKVLSMQRDGAKVAGVTYPLVGSACEMVIATGFGYYPDKVRDLFPTDELLLELEAEGYIGVPLRDAEDQVVGILNVAFCTASKMPKQAREVMSILAAKAAAEIERMQVETMLRMNQGYLDYLGSRDSLTALPNRMLFQDRLRHAVAKARSSGGQVALLLLGLDRFKKINDSLGHDIGDRLLSEVAGRLGDCLQEGTTLARLGGDEFVVILEEVENIKEVVSVTLQIQDCLSGPFDVSDCPLYVTTGIGISLFPSDGQEEGALLDCADTALGRAKEQGKSKYQFYMPHMNSRSREVLLLENGLRKALEEGQLVLHYQPQVEMVSGRIIGFEALVRWQHPEQGMVSPGDFIPLAEETGLIVPIGEWVLETACSQSVAWQRNGFPEISVAVNMSACQFRQPDLAKTVARILFDTGLDPRFLELEVTESAIMQDVEEAILTMKELTRMGLRLSIDDFGTGYSSLSYLKRFPIAKLKIDRSFVTEITSNANDAAIASSVIALTRSMNLQVIAEGVETQGQVNSLLEKGCDQGQGYFFSRPLPAGEMEEFFARRF